MFDAGSGSFVTGSGYCRLGPPESDRKSRIRRRKEPDPATSVTGSGSSVTGSGSSSRSGLSNTTWFVLFWPVRAKRVGEYTGIHGNTREYREYRITLVPVYSRYSRYSRVQGAACCTVLLPRSSLLLRPTV